MEAQQQQAPEDTAPDTPQGTSQGTSQGLSPQVEQEVDAYITGLSSMLHSKEAQGSILGMLESGEPLQTIPQTALTVNSQMEGAARQGGKPPSLDVLLNAAVFLVSDLIEIGNAAGIFQIESEEQAGPILQATLQAYIEKGLADGTMDPIELQQKIEPLLNEQQKATGLKAGELAGTPAEANEMTAMQAYGSQQKAEGMKEGALKGNGGGQ